MYIFKLGGGYICLVTEKLLKRSINDFQKVQAHMLIAKEENATRTYESLKSDYLSLKAVLTSLGVNLTEIDKIKE